MTALAEFLAASGGDDPFECSRYGCETPAVFMVAAQPCGPTCDHMHGVPVPMCAEHASGLEVVGTTGD